ncbi:MAG: hypothetical protein ACRYF4_03205 [Janthinobacterium lividum]
MNKEDASGSPRKGLLEPATALTGSLLTMLLFFLSYGYSIGDDLPFHLGSWQAAALLLRQGVYPQWEAAAAYGAGEPRFVFYPPLSWLLGALLRTLATPPHAAEWFICLAAAGCWLAMYWATRRWATVPAALLAASIYAAAPYMLFSSLQRAAFGELLAATWLPLLFAACISPAPSVAAIAMPLALLWLTNAPTAILGSYLLLFVALFQLLKMLLRQAPACVVALRAGVFAGGTALGLLLTSFFLLPALVQAKDVQLDTAFEHGQGFRDNFLIRHTALTSRQTLHEVTAMMAAYVFALLCVFVAIGVLRRRRPRPVAETYPGSLRLLLSVLACLVFFLMLPPSAFVWQHLPKLAVLQFPWRLLSLLTLVLAYAVALLVNEVRIRPSHAVLVSIAVSAMLMSAGAATYWRDPQQMEQHGLRPADVAARIQLRPTQEYTPAGANNTGLQQMDSPSCSVASVAPTETLSVHPLQLRFHLQGPATCTLPLRNYPRWTVLAQGRAAPLIPRRDGRIMLQLPAADAVVEVRWRRGWDNVVGVALSLATLLTLFLFAAHSRRHT